MDSELRRLIDGIAESVLEKIRGHGFWKTAQSENRIIHEGEPVKDLKVGDVVYMYDSDEMKITTHAIVQVIGDVGYCLYRHQPRLAMVSIDYGYAKTISEAIELGLDEIENDLADADRIIEKRKKLLELIEIHGSPVTEAND